MKIIDKIIEKIGRKGIIIVAVVLVLSTTEIFSLIHFVLTGSVESVDKKQPAKVETPSDSTEDKKQPEQQTAPSSKITEGYTSYNVKYIDSEGNKINMESKPKLIKAGGNVYQTVETAKKAGLFKEYIDKDGEFFFKVKSGTTFAWRISPVDKESIQGWSANKDNILISVAPDDSTNMKMIEYVVMIDYNQDTVIPEFNITSN